MTISTKQNVWVYKNIARPRNLMCSTGTIVTVEGLMSWPSPTSAFRPPNKLMHSEEWSDLRKAKIWDEPAFCRFLLEPKKLPRPSTSEIELTFGERSVGFVAARELDHVDAVFIDARGGNHSFLTDISGDPKQELPSLCATCNTVLVWCCLSNADDIAVSLVRSSTDEVAVVNVFGPPADRPFALGRTTLLIRTVSGAAGARQLPPFIVTAKGEVPGGIILSYAGRTSSMFLQSAQPQFVAEILAWRTSPMQYFMEKRKELIKEFKAEVVVCIARPRNTFPCFTVQAELGQLPSNSYIRNVCKRHRLFLPLDFEGLFQFSLQWESLTHYVHS